MTSKTILFKTITETDRAYNTLQKMIDVTLDCNAITYNRSDEEAVRWLVEDYYCDVGARKRIYPYPVKAIALTENTTTYSNFQLSGLKIR